MSPLLCGYIGETYGWHYGFGLATLGMLTGLAVFVAPVRITQFLIMSGAVAAALGLFYFRPDNAFSTGVNIFVGLALLIAGVIAWVALGRGGLPAEVGAPSDPQRLRKPWRVRFLPSGRFTSSRCWRFPCWRCWFRRTAMSPLSLQRSWTACNPAATQCCRFPPMSSPR